MENYKEKLESLIEHLNMLCMHHQEKLGKRWCGKFEIVEKTIKSTHETPIYTLYIKVEYRDVIDYDPIFAEGCVYERYIIVQEEYSYLENDPIVNKYKLYFDECYGKLYLKFFDYMLFAQEQEYEVSDRFGFKAKKKNIPIKDLVTKSLNNLWIKEGEKVTN